MAPDGSSLLTLDALSVQTALEGSDRESDGKASILNPPPHLLGLNPVHRSRALLTSAPALAWPAASRVVAEDAYQPLPFQHRVDQVTVEEWDGVDVGQPWVRLDVEV
jgi:hypothetical protein